MRESSALLQRFPRSDEIWQIGRFRLPVWIEEEGRAPFRPAYAVCARLPSGLVFSSELKEQGLEPCEVWETLVGAIESWGVLPGCVQVSEADLADELRARRELPVELCDGLPLLENAMSELGRAFHDPEPGPLSGKGVTLAQMASFAEAAALFAAAEPWRHLGDDDPVQIEAPEVPPEVRFVSVTGRAGEQYGLLFHREPEAFQERDEEELEEEALEEGLWAVSFNPADEVPPEDLDLWERHRLHLAHKGAFPVAALLGGPDGFRRPDARLLDVFEGLLRALASTTEDELDEGRWTREVATHFGPARFVLSLPLLLDPPRPETEIPILNELLMEQVLREIDRRLTNEGPGSIGEVDAIVRQVVEQGEARRPYLGPEEEARELASEAARARGRRGIALARRALKLWPDCADAYVALAGRETDSDRARELLVLGVEAGERALGPGLFEESAGHFWGLVRTRPYMRARLGLAEALWQGGRREEAVEHFRELLRLNPNDNQGVRYHLANALLVLRRHEELAGLLESYSEDGSTEWAYTHALLAFRRQGDSPGSRACLSLAVRRNRFVPSCLLAEELPAVPVPFLQPGSELEAISYASFFGQAWDETPGVFAWLSEGAPRPSRKKKGKKKVSRRRKRR